MRDNMVGEGELDEEGGEGGVWGEWVRGVEWKG